MWYISKIEGYALKGYVELYYFDATANTTLSRIFFTNTETKDVKVMFSMPRCKHPDYGHSVAYILKLEPMLLQFLKDNAIDKGDLLGVCSKGANMFIFSTTEFGMHLYDYIDFLGIDYSLTFDDKVKYYNSVRLSYRNKTSNPYIVYGFKPDNGVSYTTTLDRLIINNNYIIENDIISIYVDSIMDIGDESLATNFVSSLSKCGIIQYKVTNMRGFTKLKILKG
jgi:hypothetical protein